MIVEIMDALDIAKKYGDIDGAHHKAWVIDQMVRALCLTKERYLEWLAEYDDEWDEGVAP